MKKIIIVILTMILLNGCAAPAIEFTYIEPETIAATEPQPTLEELIKAEFIQLKYIYFHDSVSVYKEILSVQDYLTKLNNLLIMAEGTKNYDTAKAIIVPEIDRAIALQNLYIEAYYDRLAAEEHEARWEQRFEEHSEASQIWAYMKNVLHWSDAVCAGVMGNIMNEVGGNTLYLRCTIFDNSGRYYGICQWNAWGYPEVLGQDLEYQLNFLKETVEYEFNVYGIAYANDFDYEDFIALESPEEAALAFAQCYERCARYSYPYRTQNALTAYEYFTT
jgi:hypothetical protein